MRLLIPFLLLIASTVFAADPTFQNCVSSTPCTDVTSCEITAPTHADGDLLVFMGAAYDRGNQLEPSDTLSINEAGWTSRTTSSCANVSGTNRYCLVSTKVASAEAGTYTFEATGVTATIEFDGTMCNIPGANVNTSDPMDATVTYAFATDTTAYDAASIVTSTDGALAVVLVAAGNSTGACATPTGYAEQFETTVVETQTHRTCVQTKTVATAGTEDPASATGLGTDADWITATLAFKPAGPTFTSGPTITAITNGYNVAGTISGSGTLTVEMVCVNPGAAVPTCTQIKAGQDGSSIAAPINAQEVWTTDVANDFNATLSGAWPRNDCHVCGTDATTDTAVTSSNDLNRSADASQAIKVSTSISATSAFALQSENTCDTTLDSQILTGCADTSWLQKGIEVDLSAGFADLTDVEVKAVTTNPGTITLEKASNATTSNITVTQNAFFSPAVATGDVVEGDLLTGIGDTGTHTGSNNASILTDSAQSWVVDAHINNVVSNSTDGSSCTITDNDATTVTCTLTGGTDNDWDTSDAYTILLAVTVGADLEISFSGATGALETWGYNIQDVSDASDGDFDAGPPAWTSGDDTMYFFNTAPDFSDLASPNNVLVLTKDAVMDTFDFDDFCTEPDGQVRTYTVRSGTVPTGTSINGSNGEWTGTPTVEDEAGVTLNIACVDPGGLIDSQDIKVCVIDTITLPTFTDGDVNAAQDDELAAFSCRVEPELTEGFQCDATEAEGQVLTQNPAAATEVTYSTALSVVTSSRACQRRRRHK